MIEKNELYKKTINDFLFKTEEVLKNDKMRLYSPANNCLLAMAFSYIFFWRKKLYNTKSESLNLKPIDLENNSVNLSELFEKDLSELPIYIFAKAKVFIYLFIYLFIYWEQNKYKNTKIEENNNLPNPYFSIIKLFERGGYIYKHNGSVLANERGISQAYLLGEKSLILPTLEEVFLDYIDESFAETHLPTQQEIDVLYQKWLELKKV